MMRYACLALLLAPLLTAADERILGYHSDILVRRDGWIEVAETIRVRAEGSRIRRGIYRDYPTRYRDRFGNDVEVAYEPRQVTRDGMPEDFHVEARSNGVRTYFGSADRLLPPGEYEYIFRYDAGRMLGFFERHDELYWNVTGLGWEFPIDAASATVTLDFRVPAGAIGAEGYTGSLGDRGSDWRAVTGDSTASIETTRPLAAQEGLTVAVRWPKGFVDAPSRSQRLIWLIADNLNLLIAVAGLCSLFAWYVPVWYRFGRDPEKGIVVTRYEPPGDLSPASLRYIKQMHYDDKTMTAAVVNMAVKGYLRIRKEADNHFLEKLEERPGRLPLATGEQALLNGLFGDRTVVELKSENHKIVARARSRHRSSLKRDYANRYFRTNGTLNLPALLIATVASVFAVSAGNGATPLVVGSIAAMLIVIIVFAILLKQPTGLGRKLLDETEGFKDYLEIAEKDEMNLRNPPEKTPALFEKYLPFALALGVEQEWGERFARIFAGLRSADGSSYHPSWYSGSWNGMNLRSATSTLTGGLGSAISASASAPGSSSGGGGGGSSGGGGGGGGGGGW